MQIEQRFSGVKPEKFLAEFERAGQNMSYIVGVTCNSSSSVHHYPWGDKLEPRTSKKNIIIARSLATLGFDYFFLNPDEFDFARGIFAEAVEQFFRTFSLNDIERGVTKLGGFVIDIVVKHMKEFDVDYRYFARVDIKKVTKKMKKLEGYGTMPPGIRTGQLLNSLRFTIRKV